MEVSQGPNWGSSSKKNVKYTSIDLQDCFNETSEQFVISYNEELRGLYRSSPGVNCWGS
jgi:hypothetical protein